MDDWHGICFGFFGDSACTHGSDLAAFACRKMVCGLVTDALDKKASGPLVKSQSSTDG